MSDRIAVMNQGRYEQLGDPESLYERPATRFVAGFLGVSNLLAGDARGHRRRLRRRSGSRDDTAVRAPRGARRRPGQRSSVGVRPEKIRLRETGGAAAGRPQPARAASCATPRTSGVSTQYIVEARGGARLTVYEQNVERATRAELWSPGRGGPPDLVARPHASSSRSRAAPAGQADRAAVTGRSPAARATRGDPMTDDDTRLASELTRRRFLQGRPWPGFAAFLAACGTSGTGSAGAVGAAPAPASTERGAAPPAPAAAPQSPSAELNFANWPLYIDTDDDDDDQAQDARGLHGQVRDDGQLPRGDQRQRRVLRRRSSPRSRRPGHRLGHRRPDRLDGRPAHPPRLGRDVRPRQHAEQRRQPAGRLQGRRLGPERRPPRPVAVGHDRPRLRPARSTGDADQPRRRSGRTIRAEGQGHFLTEMRDTFGLDAAQARASDPARPTEADLDDGDRRRLPEGRSTTGIVRAFTGNEYAEDLVAGNVVLAMAWSGDMHRQAGREGRRSSALPDEGGMLWTDNMLIPKGAAHKYTAELMIDFVLRPGDRGRRSRPASTTSTPVKGAEEVLAAADPGAGRRTR